MKKTKADRARVIMNEIHDVLWHDWDPLNVNGEAPADEYDSYIGGIYRMISKGTDEDSLIGYLSAIETESMGMIQRNRESLRPIAKKIMEIDIDLKI